MKARSRLTLVLGAALLAFAPAAYAANAPAPKTPTAGNVEPAPEQGKMWGVRCEDAKDKSTKRGRCEAYQRLITKEKNQRFADAAVSFPKDKPSARGVFVGPLGILLPAGMQLKIDDGQVYKFQIRYCDGGGCYGYVDLNDDIIAAMKKGTKLTLTFQSIAQKVINVEMSLKGFGDAIKDVS